MKKIFLLILGLLILSGCSSDYLKNYILEQSGILESDEYIRYLEYKKIGKVGEDGYMIVEDADESEEGTGLLVSLVSNNHFNVSYYKNPESDSFIYGNTVKLMPGESIYATEPEIKNIQGSSYRFVQFEIYKIQDGNRVLIDTKGASNEPVYTLTDTDFNYSIAIVPVGEFIPCDINFTSTLLNDNGEESLQLTWKVDNRSVNGETYHFIPNSSFSVECSFEEFIEDYYLLESNVLPTDISDDGIIRFDNMSAESSKNGFHLVFKPYTTVEFVNIKELFKNVEVHATTLNSEFTLKSGSENMGKYEAGETLVFTIRNDYRLTANGLPSPMIVKNGSSDIYTFTIGESSPSSVTISVEKQTTDTVNTSYIANGTIILADEKGNLLNIGEEIEKDEKVTVSIKPKNGYYITGRNVTDNVYTDTMKYSDYKKNISSIIEKHVIKKFINVSIDQNDSYGDCTFYMDKEVVSGQLNLKEGDVITLEYILTDDNYQYEKWTLFSKVKKDIKITEDMNGITIKCSDYISLKKRGGSDE